MKKDQELYDDFLNGNEKAFEELITKYKNNMVYFISRYVKNLEVAEDIFQEVILYILEHKEKYNSKYSLKTYLYTIAKSKAIDYLRHEKRTENIEDYEDIEDIKLLEEIILSKERQQNICNVINRMSSDYQLVIYLTKIEGLSYKETAIVMGKTERQIKTLSYNAKKKLKQLLVQERVIEMKNNKVIRLLFTLLAVGICMSGVVFAGVTIYNEFIKKQEEITSRGLFDTGDGITTYETDLMANDMIWNKSSRLYHKIITDMEDYKKYKSRVKELPDMVEEDFNESFLIVIANENIRQKHEKDLTISEVTADETTTHIIMKQKENPNYSNEGCIWYAIVDKSLLRNNADVKIKQPNISSEKFTKLEDLSYDYSKEEAIYDGCIVTENNKVISDNLELLDKFIEKTGNGENDFIRIYRKYNEEVTIIDVNFENETYYECIDVTRTNEQRENKYYYNSYTTLKKKEGNNSLYQVQYVFIDDNDFNRGYPLLIIQ